MGEAVSVHPRRALEAYCRLKAGALEASWRALAGTWEIRLTAPGGTDLYAADRDFDTALGTLCLLAFDAMLTNQTHLVTAVTSAWPATAPGDTEILAVGDTDPARWAWLDGDDIRVHCPDVQPRWFKGGTLLRIERDGWRLEVRFTSTVTGKPVTTSIGPYPTVGDAEWAYREANRAWQQWKATQAVGYTADAWAWVDLNGFLHIISHGGLHSTFEMSALISVSRTDTGLAVYFGDPAVTSILDFDSAEHAEHALDEAAEAIQAWRATQ